MLATWDNPEEISRIECMNIEGPLEKKTTNPVSSNTSPKDTTVILWNSRFYTKETKEESWTDWKPSKSRKPSEQY